MINSKGLDCYVKEVANTLKEEFNIDIPNHRLVGRKENEKGKDLKYFLEYQTNQDEFLRNCIIIDDKPENWENVTHNVITSHKFISFSTEKINNELLKKKIIEIIPFYINMRSKEYAVWDDFLPKYTNNAPVVLEYEHSFNHQFKYLNEIFEDIYKISMITKGKFKEFFYICNHSIFIL
jgi:hypothetical protein